MSAADLNKRTEQWRYIGRRPAREHGEHPDAAEWRLLDKSAVTAVEHVRAAKRMAKDNADFGALTLDEVRRSLSRQPYHVRAGTVAAILQYLGAA